MDTRGRFDMWGRKGAALLLAGFAALIIWGLIVGTAYSPDDRISDPVKVNASLYNDVAHRMSDGQNYYRAIDESQAAHDYPTRPFLTVREPTLAYIIKFVGGMDNATKLFFGLGGVAFVFLLVGLERVSPSRLAWWAGTILSVIAVGPFMTRTSATFHEFWAGFLIVISLMLHAAGKWRSSFAVAMLAVFIRELALPLLAVMALFELLAGRRRRALLWLGGIVAFVILLAVHATIVDHTIAPTAEASPGWLKFGGWAFFVDSVRYSTSLVVLPAWVGAVVAPAALLGWLSRTGDLAGRVTVLLAGYALSFSVVGRPENYYWGLLFVALLIPGIALAPSALMSLARCVVRPEKAPVSEPFDE